MISFLSNWDDCDQVTVSYERFRKVCPQCNIVVHAIEFNRSICLRKVCPQCNTVVLHDFVLLFTRQWSILVNPQVQSHALLHRGLGTSVPFIEYLQQSRMMCWCHSLVPSPRPAFCHLQYGKMGRALYLFSCAYDVIWQMEKKFRMKKRSFMYCSTNYEFSSSCCSKPQCTHVPFSPPPFYPWHHAHEKRYCTWPSAFYSSCNRKQCRPGNEVIDVREVIFAASDDILSFLSRYSIDQSG